MATNPKQATFQSAGKVSQHIIPGAYSRIASAKAKAGFASTGNVLLLGTCLGGKPQEIQWFSSFEEAKNVIRGGNLLEVVREFFSPGGDYIPQRVSLIRVNTATQSALVLKNGLDNILTITSRDYGEWTKQLSVKVADGVAAGSKIVGDKYRTTENFTRDIIQESLSIQYTGAGTAASAAVSNTALTTTVTGGPGGEDLNLLFADYQTIGDLVDAINATGVYSAVVKTALPDDASSELDNATAADIKTAAVTLYSNLQAMINAINGQLPNVTAALVSAAPRLIPDNVDWTRLAGGGEGSSTATEWSSALTLAEVEDIQFIGTDTSSASILALVSAHVTKMNSVEGKNERQAIIGGETSLANAQTQAVGLNALGVCLAWMDFRNYNAEGVLTTFNSVHYAAKLLGQAASVAINEPLTFKPLSMIECLTKLTKTQKENAILAGVIVPEVAASGVVRTVRSITTYQGNDLKFAEFSMVREMLYISKDLRTLMEDTFIGLAGIRSRLISIETVGKDRLTDYEEKLEVIVADPNDPKGNPAWRDFQWSIDGDVIRLQFVANIVAPINFIFETHYFDILASI